ncbi:MAG: DUF2508 family protein [Ignavibacteriales bacterium]
MNLNVAESLEHMKLKGQEKFISFLDKVSERRSIITRKKKSREELEEVVENLKKARNEWVIASMNYEFAQEEDLIDYYIYLMKAAQLKYDYLLKKAKEKGAKWGFEDSFDIKTQELGAPKGI